MAKLTESYPAALRPSAGAIENDRSRWVGGLFVALLLLNVAAHAFWLWRDSRPPTFDSAGHALATLHVARLPLGEPGELLRGVAHVGPYPPWVYIVNSLPARWLQANDGGRLFDAILAGNLVFLATLYLATFEIGRRFGGRWVGLAAAALVSFYPMVAGSSRSYLLDMPLAAMTALAAWALLATECFSRRWPSALLGLSLGLGLLTKWTFVVFLAFPLLLIVWRALWPPPSAEPAQRARRLQNMVLAALIGCAVGLPWYVANFAMLRGFVGTASNLYGTLEGDPSWQSWAAWRYYALRLLDQQLLLPYALLALAGSLLVLRFHRARWQTWLLLSWVVVPYIAFSISLNKNPRYTLPSLPALAILTALGWSHLATRRPRWRRALAAFAAVIALYALLQFTGQTVGLGPAPPATVLPLRIGGEVAGVPLVIYSEWVHTGLRPSPEGWQIDAVLDDLMEHFRAIGDTAAPPQATLLVVPNTTYFEPEAFRYTVEARQLPVEIRHVTGAKAVDAEAEIAHADYFLIKEGYQGRDWSVQQAQRVTGAVQDSSSELGAQLRRIGTYTLPDGDAAALYVRTDFGGATD